ncbi:hypothetical protein GCM10027063_40020 [Promicromonospora xylanilytica]
MGVGRGFVAVAAGVLLTATGCMSTNGPTPSPTPTDTASQPAGSPSPATDSELAATNAEALVREYYRGTDVVAKDPADLSPLDGIAAEAELQRLKAQFQQWADDSWHQTGDLKVVELVTQTVTLEPSDGSVPSAQVDVCFDVTDLDIVDQSGASQVDSGRNDRGWDRLTVTNSAYDTNPDDGWRVTDAQTLEQEPCAGQ